MSKRWTKAEIDYLKRHAGRSVEELADHFRTDAKTVEGQLAKLAGGGSDDASQSTEDAALKHYDEGLGLLHKQQWEKAAALFEQVVAEADSPHLADRARQNLEVCRQRLRQADDSTDPYLEAVFEKNQGNLEDALKLCKENGKLDKDERYAYLAASIQALAGDEKEALDYLAAAIELEPKNRVHAFHDPDFKHLRDSDDFRGLVSSSRS